MVFFSLSLTVHQHCAIALIKNRKCERVICLKGREIERERKRGIALLFHDNIIWLDGDFVCVCVCEGIHGLGIFSQAHIEIRD